MTTTIKDKISGLRAKEKQSAKRGTKSNKKNVTAKSHNIKTKRLFKPKCNQKPLVNVKISGGKRCASRVQTNSAKTDITLNDRRKKLLQNKKNLVASIDWLDFKTSSDTNLLKNVLTASKEVNARGKVSQYRCTDCEQSFYSRKELRQHAAEHRDPQHACTQCDARFAKASQLGVHARARHFDLLTSPEIFICDYCGKSFIVRGALIGHIRRHARAERGRPSPRRSRFRCSLCRRAFTARAKLQLHVKCHLGMREWVCELCGKTFVRPDSFRKHMSSYHENVKRFQCPVCKKRLKGHLTEHLSVHEREKRFACDECGKAFNQKSQLTVHARTHSGARPFECRVCGESFAYSSALGVHVRRHTGERPVRCELCPARFQQTPHWRAHMRSQHGENAPYRCPVCERRCRSCAELRSHSSACEGPVLEAYVRRNLPDGDAAAADPTQAMSISRMRFLVAVLLRKISDDNRLKELGFNKRLVDDILAECLEAGGHEASVSGPAGERLRTNVQRLMDWTVPPAFMQRFKDQRRSTEELLEELAG